MNHKDTFSDSPPPPAYSEQEFDQKLSTALQESLTISDDQEWEEWDEAKFEAAVAARSRSGESKKSYPPEKKGASYTTAQSFSNTAGAGPSRYVANAGVEEQTSSGSASSSHSGQRYTEAPASSSAHQIPSTPYEDAAEHGSSTPPPTFTSVGPSLDGPPYEEVVLSYTGSYDEDDSSSSLHLSDQSLSQPQRLEYIPPPRPTSAATTVVSEASFAQERRSLPVPPRVVDERGHFGVPRPASYEPSRKTHPTAPRMSFNPSVAYKRELGSNNDLGNTFQNTAPAVAFDAAAFYNSSVSAYLKPGNTNTNDFSRPRTSSRLSSQSFHLDSSQDASRGVQRNSWMPAPVSPRPSYPSYPGMHTSLNATHFPRHPSYPSYQNSDYRTNEPRWASSEQEFSSMR